MEFKRKSNLRLLLGLGLILPVMALACRAVVPDSSPEVFSPNPAVTAVVSTPVPAVQVVPQGSGQDEDLVALYARVNPSVVNILIYSRMGDTNVALGRGSGFVYDAQGNIVTNAHVVEGAAELEAVFADGTVRAAEIIGTDLNSDLAVVKVDSLPEGAAPLPLGNMDQVAVGQTVIAIGNPFGLGGTLTKGIVSALGRNIPALTAFSIPQSIQTDAAINPGNSGGPLLNLRGEVIGVNAQIETSNTDRSNSGVGFAIPVSIVQRVVPALIKDGDYEWPWMGVRGGDVSPALVEAMKLPVERGAYLAEVSANGPADKAGLQGATDTRNVDNRTVEVGGDVVVAINGEPIRSFDDLLVYIALKTSPGQEITLTILRGGKEQTVQLTLGVRPEQRETPVEILPMPPVLPTP